VLIVDLGTLRFATEAVSAERKSHFRALQGTQLSEGQIDELRYCRLV